MFTAITSAKNLAKAYLEIVSKFAENSKELRYHGLDNTKIFDYELNSKELLALVKEELINHQPIEPAILLKIPKKNNPAKSREIFIYNIKERIKAQAIYQVLLPSFEKTFSDRLFSYRPNKPPYLAAYLFAKRYRRCYQTDQVLIIDLHNYSSFINKNLLLEKLVSLFPDNKVLDLLKLYIFNKIYDQGIIKEIEQGVVQGVPLIAMFANLYLSDLDFKYDQAVASYLRVGDDLALIDPSLEKLQALVPIIRSELEARGLVVNNDKMFIGSARGKFSFLGYEFNDGVISLEPGYINRLKLEWKRLLVYKNNSLHKKHLILKSIMVRPDKNFNEQFKRIVKEKSQVNNSAQVIALTESFFRILTEFFYGHYSARNRRLLSSLIRDYKIVSLYSYYKRFHYERGKPKKK